MMQNIKLGSGLVDLCHGMLLLLLWAQFNRFGGALTSEARQDANLG
jgi:hypothetical protein